MSGSPCESQANTLLSRQRIMGQCGEMLVTPLHVRLMDHFLPPNAVYPGVKGPRPAVAEKGAGQAMGDDLRGQAALLATLPFAGHSPGESSPRVSQALFCRSRFLLCSGGKWKGQTLPSRRVQMRTLGKCLGHIPGGSPAMCLP